MHFMSKDLAKYAGYKGVEAFQVDQRQVRLATNAAEAHTGSE